MIVLGDSHTRAYGGNPHFTPIFLGPGKVNNFVDWANVDSMLDKCHRIEAALSPKEVILCLGEPDTRYALGLGWNPWSSDRLPDQSNHIFLDKCAERYLDFYKELVTAFGWTIYVQNVALTQSPSQCRYIEYYNQILANQLGERFIEFNSRIKTESGTIHPEYAWDQIHANNKICQFVEKRLKLDACNFELIPDSVMKKHLKKNKHFYCLELSAEPNNNFMRRLIRSARAFLG